MPRGLKQLTSQNQEPATHLINSKTRLTRMCVKFNSMGCSREPILGSRRHHIRQRYCPHTDDTSPNNYAGVPLHMAIIVAKNINQYDVFYGHQIYFVTTSHLLVMLSVLCPAYSDQSSRYSALYQGSSHSQFSPKPRIIPITG